MSAGLRIEEQRLFEPHGHFHFASYWYDQCPLSCVMHHLVVELTARDALLITGLILGFAIISLARMVCKGRKGRHVLVPW
eukprot:COSAG02_NODE_36652_length_452_cov_0.796034_1_plen_79_part_10